MTLKKKFMFFAGGVITLISIMFLFGQMLLWQRKTILTSTCKALTGVMTPQDVEDAVLKYNLGAENLGAVATTNAKGRYDYGTRVNATDSVVQLNLLPEVKSERLTVSSKLRFTMGKPGVYANRFSPSGYTTGDTIFDVFIEEETTDIRWFPRSPIQSIGNHHMRLSSATDCQVEYL